jgi:hypothetical protein
LGAGGHSIPAKGQLPNLEFSSALGAKVTSDPKNKLLLVAMAQAWLKLARRAEDTRDFVYEPQAVGKPPQSTSPISDRSSTRC